MRLLELCLIDAKHPCTPLVMVVLIKSKAIISIIATSSTPLYAPGIPSEHTPSIASPCTLLIAVIYAPDSVTIDTLAITSTFVSIVVTISTCHYSYSRSMHPFNIIDILTILIYIHTIHKLYINSLHNLYKNCMMHDYHKHHFRQSNSTSHDP